MRQHEINKLNNFIGGWYLDDTSVCDELINFHKESPEKVEGHIGHNGADIVNKDVKQSIDVGLLQAPQQLAEKYILQNLQLVADAYIEKYRYANGFSAWRIIEPPNIQYYPPGGGYKQWHTERGNNISPMVARHLVFMTYLNDVDDCGETEFYYQKLKIKPEKGLTLIWGVDWMFTHRGIPSPSQEKYIVTGWYNYV
jgi:hypothetical protein